MIASKKVELYNDMTTLWRGKTRALIKKLRNRRK